MHHRLNHYLKTKLIKEKQQLITDIKNSEIHTSSSPDIETLDKLIELAKNKNYEFYNYFCEIHPNFIQSLERDFPTLTLTEKKIIAYTYFNFSTKEVADFMSNSVRTIDNNKYSLRKKINIENKKFLSDWVREYKYSLD